MKKYLLIFCLLLSSSKLFAQQFGQYNTGTLYESFENLAERSFIPDTSKMFASNFFFPTFSGNISLTGDAQVTLKSRLFTQKYMNSALQVGGPTGSGEGNPLQQIGSTGHTNYIDGNFSDYLLMFKWFINLDGNQEVGFFLKANSTVRGTLTDESVALLNGSASFPGTNYNNVLNSNYHYQSYYEYGATYREQVTKRLSLGFKYAFIAGIQDQNVNIRSSNIAFDKSADTASLTLGGNHNIAGNNFSPFHNPGAAISVGTDYKFHDGYSLQVNLKDLGFIHWNSNAKEANFSDTKTINGLTGNNAEKNVLKTYNSVIDYNDRDQSYTTLVNGSFDVAVSKWTWIDDERTIKYSPTLVVSKDIAYKDFTVGLVNPVYYKSYSLSVITSYNDQSQFNLGLQFMYKSDNCEFFIASQSLPQSVSFLRAGLKNQTAINTSGAYSGGDISIGFTYKFGDLIEHPMNASHIPMGDDDKGFLGKLFQKIFHPKAGTIQNN